MITTVTTAAVLERARQMLDGEFIWIQRWSYMTRDGGHISSVHEIYLDEPPVGCCLLGALWLAAADLDYDHTDILFNRAAEALRQRLPEHSSGVLNSCVADFNDEPGRTKEDVLQVLAATRDAVTP